MTDIAQIVGELAQLDVGFYCTHQNQWGQATVPLSTQELLQYAQDPVGYLAAYYKVSRDQYLAWHRSNYTVLCAGKTRAKRPCKNIVEGGNGVTPRQWVDLQGSYCHVHQ